MSRTRRPTPFQALCALILMIVLILLQSAPSPGDYKLLPKWVTDGQSMTQDRYLHHATDLTRRYDECDWANLDVSGTSKCAERVRYGDKVLCLLGKSLADSQAEQSQFIMSIAKMESEYGWITKDTPNQSPTGMGLNDAFEALNIDPAAAQWISLKQEHGKTPTVPATHGMCLLPEPRASLTIHSRIRKSFQLLPGDYHCGTELRPRMGLRLQRIGLPAQPYGEIETVVRCRVQRDHRDHQQTGLRRFQALQH